MLVSGSVWWWPATGPYAQDIKAYHAVSKLNELKRRSLAVLFASLLLCRATAFFLKRHDGFLFQNPRGCLKHVFWRTLFRQNSRCSLSSGEFAWVVGTMQNPTANKSPYHSDARTVSDRLRANKSKCHLRVSTCCELDSLLTYRSIERQRGSSVVTLISLRPIGVCWKKNSARNQREVRSDWIMPQVQERPF